MRLVVQTGQSWQYHLDQNEADILLGMIKQFPFNELEPAQISRLGQDDQAAERQKLLAELLAEHRKELRQLGLGLLAADKWEQRENGCRLTLDAGARETLLQVLNDIRVGCWHALGEPELEDFRPAAKRELWQYNLMEVAGYFEANLLEPEE